MKDFDLKEQEEKDRLMIHLIMAGLVVVIFSLAIYIAS